MYMISRRGVYNEIVHSFVDDLAPSTDPPTLGIGSST
jgi:hypothetical protein